MSSEIPQWVYDLDTPDPETIYEIYEQCLPAVQKQLEQQLPSRLFWLRRQIQKDALEQLGPADICAELDEAHKGSHGTTALGIHFVGKKLMSGDRMYSGIVSQEASEAIVTTLTQEHRQALVNAVTQSFCHFWAETVPSLYSLKHEIGQKAFRLSKTFNLLLREEHERLLALAQS